MQQDKKDAAANGDSPKRHGDKLGLGTEPKLEQREAQPSGDSPKRQGDKLGGAMREGQK